MLMFSFIYRLCWPGEGAPQEQEASHRFPTKGLDIYIYIYIYIIVYCLLCFLLSCFM